MSNSSFSSNAIDLSSAEKLNISGATCDCYRMKIYGKQHFVKRLKPELTGDPRYMEMLQKEFETGYQLEHPNLVRYYLMGEDYIATEYVDGETLTHFVHRCPDFFKKKANRKKIIDQLLSVTEYLHAHQVLHLDLKPDNIMVTKIGHDLKLVDLGFSYTGTFPDTKGYTRSFAAPEQLKENGIVDERTDIFALGKILEVIPFTSGLKSIVKQCTRTGPKKRYQNVGELRNALKRLTIQHKAIITLCMLAVTAAFLWIFFSQRQSDKQGSYSTNTMVQVPDTHNTSMPPTSPAQPDINVDSTTTIEKDKTQEPPIHQEAQSAPAPVDPSSNINKPANLEEVGSTDSGKTRNSVVNVNQVIQEFKAEVRPYVIKMYDWYVAHGGVGDFQGEKVVWLTEQYLSLRNEYNEKHFKPIEIKYMKKYGDRLTELDKYALPEQFERAISEIGNAYQKQIEQSLNPEIE